MAMPMCAAFNAGASFTPSPTITVTPHISEGDFLQLEYTVALNSFTGAANANR